MYSVVEENTILYILLYCICIILKFLLQALSLQNVTGNHISFKLLKVYINIEEVTAWKPQHLSDCTYFWLCFCFLYFCLFPELIEKSSIKFTLKVILIRKYSYHKFVASFKWFQPLKKQLFTFVQTSNTTTTCLLYLNVC